MRTLLLALVVSISSYTLGQVADAKPSADQADLAARKTAQTDLGKSKKTLLDLSSDLEGMAGSLRGVDVDNALAIDQRATFGVTYVDATAWFLATYNRMECDTDRAIAKAVLTDRLGFYSKMLGMAADQTNGYLAYSRVPAVAQQGRLIKDELRNAKNKLDEIAASLK
jgi:hypothetical protein